MRRVSVDFACIHANPADSREAINILKNMGFNVSIMRSYFIEVEDRLSKMNIEAPVSDFHPIGALIVSKDSIPYTGSWFSVIDYLSVGENYGVG